MTEAPPPATMVQTRPFGLRTVSLSEAPVCSSRYLMYASSLVRPCRRRPGTPTRPRPCGSRSSRCRRPWRPCPAARCCLRGKGEGVDLEVGEAALGVEGVERLDEGLHLGLALARVGELRTPVDLGRVGEDRDADLDHLVPVLLDVDAALDREVDDVLVALAADRDVPLVILRVRHERLDQKVCQIAGGLADLWSLDSSARRSTSSRP